MSGIMNLFAALIITSIARQAAAYFAVEQTLNGLLWLNDNGILRCRIIIIGTELDEETGFVARAMAEDHRCITFVENGELPEWMKTNC